MQSQIANLHTSSSPLENRIRLGMTAFNRGNRETIIVPKHCSARLMANYDCAKKDTRKIPGRKNVDHQASQPAASPSKSGYIQLSLHVYRWCLLFQVPFFDRYVVDWLRNSWDSARKENKRNSQWNKLKNAHAKKKWRYKLQSLNPECFADWDLLTVNVEFDSSVLCISIDNIFYAFSLITFVDLNN